jgi:hypothetical protein
MAESSSCQLCGREIPPHCHYVVRIEVFADPSMPPVTSEELAQFNLDEEMKRLLAQMEHMSAEELQDQVHRKFEYCICRECQMRFLANPLGRPRGMSPGGATN